MGCLQTPFRPSPLIYGQYVCLTENLLITFKTNRLHPVLPFELMGKFFHQYCIKIYVEGVHKYLKRCEFLVQSLLILSYWLLLSSPVTNHCSYGLRPPRRRCDDREPLIILVVCIICLDRRTYIYVDSLFFRCCWPQFKNASASATGFVYVNVLQLAQAGKGHSQSLRAFMFARLPSPIVISIGVLRFAVALTKKVGSNHHCSSHLLVVYIQNQVLLYSSYQKGPFHIIGYQCIRAVYLYMQISSENR